MKRLVIFVIEFLFVIFYKACALESDSYKLFGQTAHNNPGNLYIAALSVGTGECHIIRKNNKAVMIDAGFRCKWMTERECINHISEMMLYKNGNENEHIHLENLFLTHSHDDHNNLVIGLIDDEIIDSKKIFLGGERNKYSLNIVQQISLSIQEKKYNFDDFSVQCCRIKGKGKGKCNDINGHGSAIFLEFGNRKAVFSGDINKHTAESLGMTGHAENHCLKEGSEAPQIMTNVLKNADIVTTPHHGSLNNGEDSIYTWLGTEENKKERIFIASAAPCSTGSATNPRIKKEILQKITTASGIGDVPKQVFNHKICFDIEHPDHQCEKNTTVPLFSTHDAPGGFVWICMEPNGRVSICDNISEENIPDFKEVLGVLH